MHLTIIFSFDILYLLQRIRNFSNLPLDYLNGVLPTAQFGSESVVSLTGSSTSGDFVLNDLQISAPSTDVSSDVTVLRTKHSIGNIDGSGIVTADSGYNYLGAVNSDTVKFTNTGMRVSSLKGSPSVDSSTLGPSLSIAALRQAYAAQKYKEIQLANDVDFASQIEAHFGVKPKHADDVSALS